VSLRRARSVDEYVDWVKQAVFEAQDLPECLEFEPEDQSRFPAYRDPPPVEIAGLYRSMHEGADAFGREDLTLTDLVTRCADEIPFQTLLKQINETHRRGLELEDDHA
jgi:hypothetical protein